MLDWPRASAIGSRILGGAVAHRLLAASIAPRPGTRVLDLGCGAGAFRDALPRDVFYVGVDVNPAYIVAAQRRYGARGMFLVGDVTTLDFSGLHPFDAAVASFLLHRFDDAAIEAVRQVIRRVVRPGGTLVTIDPDAGARGIAGWIVREDRGMHLRTEAGYRALLEPLGSVTTERRNAPLRIASAHVLARVTLR
ncbi:MAG TPA: methyltransferase domain-containing protein [Vicinamibacterales bacterium]|nr:methyltransferase domain-containing protein [Vicinamibacterales bacterium]